MFHSTEFSIENRPGLEDQSIEKVLHALHRLGAPDILPSTHSTGGDSHKRIELAKWLSDWHLIAFLGTTGLIPEVCFRAYCAVAQLIERCSGRRQRHDPGCLSTKPSRRCQAS